jgi:hypothetical protein
VLLAVLFTALTVVAVLGHDPFAGRVLFGLSETHGVHLGDLPFVGAWAVVIAGCWWLWRRGGN